MATLALPTAAKRPVALALPGAASTSATQSPAPAAPTPAPAAATTTSTTAAPPRPRASASPSPDPEDDADADGDEDEDEGGGGGASKKSKGAKPKKKAALPLGGGSTDAAAKQEYKYTSEISQMMFVFGEVQEPLQETVRLVEDIVRGQIIEIVTRARLLTHLRSSRFLSAEDLIFLIRDDRGKVNRLRTYLSWKDVRKRAKEDEGVEGVEVDVDDAAAGGDKNNAATKGRKQPIVKLSWELLTPLSDFLRALPTQANRTGLGADDDDDDEDDDETQAHEVSMRRLRDADEITNKMTKDEYVHYSDCRQASFTYRKARRFREFINFSAYLDVRPNDDIIDILGFLAFEMVRSLCVTALEVREQLERSAPGGGSPSKRKAAAMATAMDGASPSKRLRLDGEGTDEAARTAAAAPRSLFAPPPSARQPLLPSHVLEAFAQIQRKQTSNRIGGLRNWRGGISRGRVALV